MRHVHAKLVDYDLITSGAKLKGGAYGWIYYTNSRGKVVAAQRPDSSVLYFPYRRYAKTPNGWERCGGMYSTAQFSRKLYDRNARLLNEQSDIVWTNDW